MVISIFQFLLMLAFMVLCVDCAPIPPDHPVSPNSLTAEQMEALLLVHQTARVHALVDESKERRPYTPRRKFVAEQDLGKYDYHREFEHRHDKAEEMAHYILHERPVRHYEEK